MSYRVEVIVETSTKEEAMRVKDELEEKYKILNVNILTEHGFTLHEEENFLFTVL